MESCGIWYVRFGMSFGDQLVACGNQEGHILVWDLLAQEKDRGSSYTSPPTRPCSRIMAKLVHSKNKSTVRQVAFSPDGKFLVAVCDDGSVWRWDRTPTE